MQRLLAAVLLAAPALAAPAGTPTDPSPSSYTSEQPTPTSTPPKSCAQLSTGFTGWDLSGLEYHASYIFTTPAHQNSWGYFNFNVTNPMLDLTVPCQASSNQLSDFFYGTVNYNCQMPEGANGSFSFSFSRPSGEVAVNETWSCPPDSPQFPGARFEAGGSTVVQLNCRDATYQNPNWTTPGDIYSSRTVTCDPIDLHLKPSWIRGVA